MNGKSRFVEAAPFEALLAIAGDADERTLLAAATRLLVPLLGERGSCVLLDGTPRVVFSTHTPKLENVAIDLMRYPEISAAIEERAVVTVEDARSDDRLAQVRAWLPAKLRSIVVVPLTIADRHLGVLIAQSTAVRRMSAEAAAMAALLGPLTAMLLESARFPPHARAQAQSAPDTLNARKAVSLAIARGRSERTEPLRRGGRILAIDDDNDVVSTVAMILEEEGYLVEVASNGAQGVLRACQAPVPNLVLLDVCMPFMDGFAVAERLHEDPLTCGVPILFLSGADDLMIRVRGIREVDFLSKPFSRGELVARVERSIGEAEIREKLRSEANMDELTGLGNSRFFNERLAVEQARWDRHRFPLTMVMMDVDKLKQINDQRGHITGSQTLAAVGRVLREQIRGADVAVKYGGDEFVVLLPHTKLADGMGFGERTLAAIRKLASEGLPVTVSMGVASVGATAQTPATLLQQADAACYHAKHLGGDQACAFDPNVDLPKETVVNY